MSDDMLGSLVRVLVTVPVHRLGLLKSTAHKLIGDTMCEWEEELKKFLRKEPCWVPKERLEVNEPKIVIPNLRSTGPTIAEWLKVREELHQFFTGERVILRDLFALTDEDLVSTTLMPAFRPAGATNCMAVTWKQRIGITVYEDIDVMKYTGSEGPKEPKLYLVNCSLRPDEDTLGENAKTPDQLIQVRDKHWLDLFGYCDADNLHWCLTREHLDPETRTWFPSDRSGRYIAYGGWNPYDRKVYLSWSRAGCSHPTGGARSAREVPLRKR